jgi:hypothetical protein
MDGYREQIWSISQDRSSEGLLIAAFDHEQELFELGREGKTTRGFPIDLFGLMDRTDRSIPRWTKHRISTDDSRRDGTALWEALPPPFQSHLKQSGPDDRALNLKISSEVPGVADLPWEWLFDGTDPPFALRSGVRLIRSVPARLPVPSLSISPPIRVLLLVPNPKDERLLDAWTEINTVTTRLHAPDYEFRILEEPSLDMISDVFANWFPNVMHYIGHGGLTYGEGNLIFHGAEGRSRWIGATELSSLLPSSVRLLCLSTPCTTRNYQVLGLSHLGRAQGLVGLPTTVANQYPVDRDTVRTFWQAFYSTLTERAGNVNEATHAARVAAAGADPAFADWGSFSLTIRDQTGVPFDLGPARTDPARRRKAELSAQFATQMANDLAAQVDALGEEAPGGLREQYETERSRAAGLLDELSKEA